MCEHILPMPRHLHHPCNTSSGMFTFCHRCKWWKQVWLLQFRLAPRLKQNLTCLHIYYLRSHTPTQRENTIKKVWETAVRHSLCISYLRTQQNIARNFIYCFLSKNIIRKDKKQSTSHMRRSAIPVPNFRALHEALWIFVAIYQISEKKKLFVIMTKLYVHK